MKRGFDDTTQKVSDNFSFKCTGDLCDGTEVVLTQRPSRWNIEQSYFAKKELPELEKVCGLGETMHEGTNSTKINILK